MQDSVSLHGVTYGLVILVGECGGVKGDDEIDLPFCDVAFEDALDDVVVPVFILMEILVLEEKAVFRGDGVFEAGGFCFEVACLVFVYCIRIRCKK